MEIAALLALTTWHPSFGLIRARTGPPRNVKILGLAFLIEIDAHGEDIMIKHGLLTIRPSPKSLDARIRPSYVFDLSRRTAAWLSFIGGMIEAFWDVLPLSSAMLALVKLHNAPLWIFPGTPTPQELIFARVIAGGV